MTTKGRMMIGNGGRYSDLMDVELSESHSPEDGTSTPSTGAGEVGRQNGRQRILLVGITLLAVIAVVVGTTLGVVRPGGASSQESSATASTGDQPSPTPHSTVMHTLPTTTTQPTTREPTPVVNASTLPPGSEPYVCTGDDRLNHEEPLYSGQVLCSSNDKYVFGMHSDGRFIKWDVVHSFGKFDTFYTGQPGDWFIMRQNGDIEIFNLQNELQWKREAKSDMTFATCLSEYPCPYMHLHDDGVLVLNWRDSNGVWQVHRIKEAYDL